MTRPTTFKVLCCLETEISTNTGESRIGLRILLGLLLGVAAYAQSASVLRPGAIEAGVFGGQALNQDQRPWMFGGNVSYALNKYILPYAEFTRFPRIDISVNRRIPGLSAPVRISASRIPLLDFHGGVHIRVPIPESRVIPYLAIGIGALKSPDREFNVLVEGIQFPFALNATTVAAANFGGGIRFYVNQRFGFRVEAKYYRGLSSIGVNTLSTSIEGTSPASFGKYEAGFFYQFR